MPKPSSDIAGVIVAMAASALLAAFAPAEAAGQVFRRAGAEFTSLRSVTAPAGASIVVTEFLHGGQIVADGRNIVACTRRGDPVPSRVLQLGPGDFCRVAIGTAGGQAEYDILYGGKGPTQPQPKWTADAGLLLETRHYRPVRLRNYESLRDAFDRAEPFGADYVEGVFQAANPFATEAGPFLSHYGGRLQIASAGRYRFITSSQDASFLLIDGKVVAAAEGRHPAVRRARPEMAGTVQLSAGAHDFDYYHVATGDDAVMAALWEPNAQGDKPQQPVKIPPEAFRANQVAHVAADPPSSPNARLLPDFNVRLVGEVPLPDNPRPLVVARFVDGSPKGLAAAGKIFWQFGDGQTSDRTNPEHVYLRPGVYAITLCFLRGGDAVASVTHRVAVGRPTLGPDDKNYALDELLPQLKTYDLAGLDATAIGQLVAAYEAKADQLRAAADSEAAQAEANPPGNDEADEEPSMREGGRGRAEPPRRSAPGRTPARPARGSPQSPPAATSRSTPRSASSVSAADRLRGESQIWYAAAVEAGKAALVESKVAADDEALLQLARKLGPLARETLGDSRLAFELWRGASQRLTNAGARAEAAVAAADVAINDLLDPAAAKSLLDMAEQPLRRGHNQALRAALARVQGDYAAAQGDGAAARDHYAAAQRELDGDSRGYLQQTARRGAHSRSTEAFLKSRQWQRAAAELHAWEQEFPGDRVEGYLSLLTAEYWVACQQGELAIAQCERLLAVNPASPYADRLLLIAADCESDRGRKDRAIATLHTLLQEYPGSEKVAEARQRLADLESAASDGATASPRRGGAPAGTK